MKRGRKNIEKIIHALRSAVNGKAALDRLRNPFRVLISTILSQRTKDANTARAAKQLFSRYKTPRQIANARIAELQRLIKPAGFYREKAKRIKRASVHLLRFYNGRVPKTREALMAIEGVGAKTAGCVLVYGFGIPAIPVDTHVHRVSNRIGFVSTKTPEQTELALMQHIPKKYWIELNSLLVRFGQQVCLPRNPRCSGCRAAPYCDFCTNMQ